MKFCCVVGIFYRIFRYSFQKYNCLMWICERICMWKKNRKQWEKFYNFISPGFFGTKRDSFMIKIVKFIGKIFKCKVSFFVPKEKLEFISAFWPTFYSNFSSKWKGKWRLLPSRKITVPSFNLFIGTIFRRFLFNP